ncbi:MAG: SWIM zinc finger family protein [Chloroflexi bacterium]|nr:SWIM zinc finger family protein [Chloroflexota bacterium]
MKPKNIKRLQERGKDLRAYILNPNLVVVESTSHPLANHVVTIKYLPDDRIYARCTCPWAINGGVACSHVIAALEHLAEVRGRRLSFWTNEADAQRQKHRLFFLTGGQRNDGVWITSRSTRCAKRHHRTNEAA